VQVETAEELPPIRGDSLLLDRVIVNLVENASRYTPPGQPVRVTIVRRAETVEVAVADDGPGIPEEDLERVFRKFQRGESDSPGVGLGLTICKAIVEAHGGRIWAESPLAHGRGTAIHFTLPLGDLDVSLKAG